MTQRQRTKLLIVLELLCREINPGDDHQSLANGCDRQHLHDQLWRRGKELTSEDRRPPGHCYSLALWAESVGITLRLGVGLRSWTESMAKDVLETIYQQVWLRVVCDIPFEE